MADDRDARIAQLQADLAQRDRGRSLANAQMDVVDRRADRGVGLCSEESYCGGMSGPIGPFAELFPARLLVPYVANAPPETCTPTLLPVMVDSVSLTVGWPVGRRIPVPL